jgi:hypothetical protein
MSSMMMAAAAAKARRGDTAPGTGNPPWYLGPPIRRPVTNSGQLGDICLWDNDWGGCLDQYGDPCYTCGGPPAGGGGQTVIYVPPGGGGGGGNATHWFDNIIGVVSQAFQAWGHNPTNQVAPGGAVIQNPTAAIVASQANAQIAASQYQGGGVRGGAAEDAFAGLGNYVGQHPFLVLGLIGGVILLFRQPPGKR